MIVPIDRTTTSDRQRLLTCLNATIRSMSALLDPLTQLKLIDVSDRIRSVTLALCQELIDAEATAWIGAGEYDRNDDRTTHRNAGRHKWA